MKHKFLTIFINFTLILSVSLAPQISSAAVMKPIRIMLPGNFSGNTFSWKGNKKPFPEVCWRIPDFILSLYNQKNFINTVIDVGNNSSVYSPSSYITDGKIDQHLATLCKAKVSALGPKDLGVFRNMPLSTKIRERIWTNITQNNEGFLFPPKGVINNEDFKMRVYSFISNKYVKNFPLIKWGNIQVISPALALRKLMPKFNKDSLTVIIAHLTEKDTKHLISQLNKYKGTFFFVHIAQNKASRLDAIPDTLKNVFYFKISDGCHKLPTLTIQRKNFSTPRINVKIIPLKKASSKNSLNLFNEVSDIIFNILNTIIKVIPRTITEAPFRFIPAVHAEFARDYSRSNISILVKPDSSFQESLVFRNFDLFNLSKNFFIYKFRLKGHQIQELILNLTNQSKNELIFGGCDFRLFAGKITSFNIHGQTLLPNRFYSISVSSEILNNSNLSRLFRNISYKRNEGVMSWDIWRKKLPRAKISSDLLDN